MASKELINKVALSSGITKRQAEAALSTILAALQDPTEAVLKAGHETIYEGDYDASMDFALHPTWCAMLAASPLGEQSE